jgi:Phage terminase, small subunit
LGETTKPKPSGGRGNARTTPLGLLSCDLEQQLGVVKPNALSDRPKEEGRTKPDGLVVHLEKNTVTMLGTLDDCTVLTTKGNLIQHSLVGLKNRTHQNLLRIGAELGLSPFSRTRLHVQPADEPDPLMEFLNRRKQRFFGPHPNDS